MNKKFKTITSALMIVMITSLIGCTSNEASSDTNENNNIQIEATDSSHSDGLYLIGDDMAAGEYLLIAQDEYASFAITADDSGSAESAINGNAFSTHFYINVEEGQQLELNSCLAMPIETAPVQSDIKETGMYKVGRDIEAGIYVLTANDPQTNSIVLKDLDNTDESQIAFDMFDSHRYYDLKDGQYIHFYFAELIALKDAPIFNYEDGIYKAAMYQVGRDIKPGDYTLTPLAGESVAYTILSSLDNTVESKIISDYVSETIIVTLTEGQYIQFEYGTLTN